MAAAEPQTRSLVSLPKMSSSSTVGNFATSAAGPALACIITNPADVAKTQLNLERELQSSAMSRNTGSLECMRRIWAAEGLAGLQRGLYFAMIREASKNTFRIGLYQPIVDAVHDKRAGPAPLPMLMGAGAAATPCPPPSQRAATASSRAVRAPPSAISPPNGHLGRRRVRRHLGPHL